MANSAQLETVGQVIRIVGSIDFENAAQVYEQGRKLLQQQQSWPVRVNLSELTSSHTIVLAVFVQWLRQCKAQQSIVLEQVPEQMKAIIHASNLLKEFGIH